MWHADPYFDHADLAYHAFGKYLIQARGLLNYRLKYCWLKIICCVYQSNKPEREISTKLGGKNWGQPKSEGPWLPQNRH